MIVSVAPIKCTDELDDGSVLELRVDCRWSWRFTSGCVCGLRNVGRRRRSRAGDDEVPECSLWASSL